MCGYVTSYLTVQSEGHDSDVEGGTYVSALGKWNIAGTVVVGTC